MSQLWSELPESFGACGNCAGTGRVRCSSCGGVGVRYETRYDYDYEGRSISRTESVSCSLCGGTGDRSCTGCGGTGSILKHSTRPPHADPPEEDDEVIVDPYEGQTEAELIDEMFDGQMEILDWISECSQLSSELRDEWYRRLRDIDPWRPDAEVELNKLKIEVKDCYEDEDEDASSLSLITAGLSLLRSQAARYQRRFGSEKPQAVAEPIPARKPILREDIKALARSSSSESIVKCPICSVEVKATNLVKHCDAQHRETYQVLF